MVLTFGSAAWAQYGTTTTTSTTTTSSTTTTTLHRGASPGPTNPTGSGNSEEVGVSARTTTPGSAVTVQIAGGSGPSGIGPCGAGVPVSIYLQQLQNRVAPVLLGSGTSTSTGGLAPISVTIPTTVPLGTYVIYATCANGGSTEVITSPLVVVNNGSSGHTVAARVFPDITTAAPGTPAMW